MSLVRIAVIGADRLDPDHHLALNQLSETERLSAFALDADADESGFEILQTAMESDALDAIMLTGARETLQRCDFAILELSVTQRFAGVGLPSQAIALLAEAGLEWRDVLSIGSGPGKRAQPRYMDVLFTRWTS